MGVYIGDIGGPMERVDHQADQDHIDWQPAPEMPTKGQQEVTPEIPVTHPVVITSVKPGEVPPAPRPKNYVQ